METILQLFENVNQTAPSENSGIAEDTLRENQNFPFVTFVVSLIALGGIVKLSSKVKRSLKTSPSDFPSKPSASVIPELPSHPLIGPLYPLLRKGI